MVRLTKLKYNCPICGHIVMLPSCFKEEIEDKNNTAFTIESFCKNTQQHIIIERQNTYYNIDLKTRKRYLDKIREGLTVGECNKKLGLTFDEGNSILWFNINLNKYYTLNKEPARQIGEVENV